MLQHKESDFVIPVLKTIRDCKSECTTEHIKRNVGKYINLSDKDLTPYPSRNPNEPRYYQVIGNLISHKNADLFKYVNQVFPENDTGEKSRYRIFILNEEGVNYLEKLNEQQSAQMEIIISDKHKITDAQDEPKEYSNESVLSEDFTITDTFDKKIMEYALKNGLSKRPPTDSKIANTIIELSGYKCEYAVSKGKKHNLFAGKSKKPFMEGHHLVPMKASKDFFPLNLDRPSNVVSLCPGCHALLHHATNEEKKEVLMVLYNNHIEQLNADGIYISFEKLLSKYY